MGATRWGVKKMEIAIRGGCDRYKNKIFHSIPITSDPSFWRSYHNIMLNTKTSSSLVGKTDSNLMVNNGR
jgi:hypothetical protein